MDELFDLLAAMITWAIPYILVLAVIAISMRFAIERGIQAWKRRRARLTKSQFKALGSLLALESIVELYAPASRYMRELKDKERPLKLAWLSPYARAVRASFKRNRSSTRGKNFAARAQIADAAERIEIAPLPVDTPGYEEPDEHFLVTFKLDGHDPETFKKMEGRIKGQLGLATIKEIETKDNFSTSFELHKVEPIDPLTTKTIGVEFFEENKCVHTAKVPLAIMQSGRPWLLPFHHFLVLGTTGSGKGSVINGLILQYAPFVEYGSVKLYGIDIKMSELRPYDESSLFEEIAYETAPGMAVIAEVHQIMKDRAQTKTVDVENAELGRSLSATKETPQIVLIIDEFLSLLIAFQGEGRDGKEAIGLLTAILAQGRSLGVFVVAATQEADRDLLGRMRGNFANVAVLRHTSAYFNDLFLGEGAKDKGFDATAIPPANVANKYATAGIGYVKNETGGVVKVRFAYLSDKDLSNLIKAYPKKKLSAIGEESVGIDDDDEGGFDFENIA